MFLKQIGRFFLILFSFAILTAQAAESPLPTLQNTANKIITELQQNKVNLRTNPKISYQIVTKYLVPLVDQDTMAQSVIGRAAWKSATSSQKLYFIKEFKTLVVRTYSAAIAQFSDEKIEFKPLRGNLAQQKQVIVYSQIIRNNAPAIPVSYTLNNYNGRWMIVDFAVDNVSMVQSFKSQFQNELNNKGLDALIASLKEHNTRNG